MAKLKEALLKIAEKVGMDKDADFLTVLAASALNEIDVPDTFVSATSGLMTEDQAIEFGSSNIKVKTHHLKNYLTGFDESVVDLAKAAKLPDEIVREIKQAQNSGDKVKMLAAALQAEIETAKKSGKGGSEEYVKQVTELQNKVKELETQTEQKVNETKSQYVARLEKLALKAHLGFNWNESVPDIARESVYTAAIDAELAKKGAKRVFDENSNDYKIVQIADETLPLIEAGKQLGFSDFHSLALQNHKLIKEGNNSGGTGGNNSGNNGFKSPDNRGEGTDKKIPSYMQRQLEQSQTTLAEMAKANQ